MIAVILSSQFVEINLQVEYGKITPIELPLFNKTLFDHQLKSLAGVADEVFITLPHGHLPRLIDFPNIIYVDENLSLIEVLQEVSSRFDANETLFIYYGDTLISNTGKLIENTNYAFIQKPKFNYAWAKTTLNEFVYAGGFVLKNDLLFKCIAGVSDFDSFLSNITNSTLVENYSDFGWFDFGHPYTYYDSRKQFLESRAFNRLEFQNGFLKKSSLDIFKVWCEYSWLQNAKGLLANHVPQVKGFNILAKEASYEVEYINKAVLSDVFVFGNQPNAQIIEILKSIKVQLDVLTSGTSFNDISSTVSNSFMHLKLQERQSEIELLFEGEDEILSEINKHIKENLDFFKDKKYANVPMHGDLCFSNIIYDFSLFTPILIDPRGYLFRDIGFSFNGPKIYDILKLAHSYVAGYDFIVAGYYNHDFFQLSQLSHRLNQFLEIFEIERVELIMGMKNLFLSMIPLHKESKERIKGFLFILNQLNQL
jgi:hypothetical protein